MKIFKYIARIALLIALFAGLFEANNLYMRAQNDELLLGLLVGGLSVGLISYSCYFLYKKHLNNRKNN
ncbi:hypothetical protein [Weissella oryzae]|uniref:hypothetical protein n=1 Tax=Weissella oryzae TaxID=1129792 RepID=UPI000AC8FE6E|nr:hypothetical protein [Weissella oryzae]